MARRERTNFTEQYKKDAAKLAEKMGSQKAAAAKLGISVVNMHNWVKKYSGKPVRKTKENSIESLRIEIRELNQTLKELVEVLSKGNRKRF